MINKMQIQPRQFTLKNILGILEIFGLQGNIVVKEQGWSRCYVQHRAPATRLEPNPIPLQFGRVMFKFGKFSHFNFYLDPSGRIHETMYYEVALRVFQLTGIELDAPAWSDLVARATEQADKDYEAKRRERETLNQSTTKKRRKLNPPNYAHTLVKVLEKDLSEVFDRPVPLCLF